MPLLSDYDYDLPDELIAQVPAEHRSESRMLTMRRSDGACEAKSFSDFPSYLKPGDCLVLNDTKVIPARLYGKKATGGHVEALLLDEIKSGLWTAMLKPGRRLKDGTKVSIDGCDASFEVVSRDDGDFTIRFDTDDVHAMLEQAGHMPLPPYIDRNDEDADKLRYQTVFASTPGAVAAPTAGLHFTPEILKTIEAMGVTITKVTLHVGAGTFLPVKEERVEDHRMHFERYAVSESAAATINTAKANGGRIVAVGTTSVRTLESSVEDGCVVAGAGSTDLFMYPPTKPQIVDMLLTNFHLPKSTLLMLVSCFSTRENLLAAYQVAIGERMRFFSYGDCMLVY